MSISSQIRGEVPELYRASVFLLFVAGGLAIFLFGNNWSSRFPTNDSDLYKWSLAALFGVIALILRGPQRAQLRAIVLSLFSAALANAVLATVGQPVASLLPAPGTGAQRLAFDKVAQAITVVLTLLGLTLLIDHNLGGGLPQEGRLPLGHTFRSDRVRSIRRHLRGGRGAPGWRSAQ